MPINFENVVTVEKQVQQKTDKTLTIQDRPADAKTVGDRLIEIVNSIDNKIDKEIGKSLIQDTLITKLESIDDSFGAITSISVNGTLLDIIDKNVNIPIGAGLLSSDEIIIDNDNILTIGQINVNKLVQTNGEKLVLNGGTSYD